MGIEINIRRILGELVVVPKNYNVVIGEIDGGIEVIPFKCPLEKNYEQPPSIIGKLLRLIAVGLLKKIPPSLNLVEKEFPKCLSCPRFAISMLNQKVSGPQEILGLFSKDMISGEKLDPDDFFSKN